MKVSCIPWDNAYILTVLLDTKRENPQLRLTCIDLFVFIVHVAYFLLTDLEEILLKMSLTAKWVELIVFPAVLSIIPFANYLEYMIVLLLCRNIPILTMFTVG